MTLASPGYAAPAPREIPAAGESALATLKLGVHLMRQADYISDHDQKVANHVAHILCGGAIPPGTMVSEQYLLDLERQAFLSLCGERKTQERIAYTLKNRQAAKELNRGMNVARIAALRAGLPVSTSAMTVNRFCASGLQSIAMAADRIRGGGADVILAGGTESMSMVLWAATRSAPIPGSSTITPTPI